jgi:PadR family transcriptional regulator PadR
MSRAIPTLSSKERLILELLVEREEMYGLQLVDSSRRRLKRGTVYVTLGRMEDKGYVTARREQPPSEAGGLPRRIYRATPLGRRLLEAWAHVAQQLTPELAR